MKLIPLTKGQHAMVDDDDFEKISQFNWSCWNNSNRKVIQKYAMRNRHKHESGYVEGERKKIKMHRFIMGIDNPKIFIDHIDGNGLNNQKNNLRVANHSENAKNTKSWGVSKYLGVSLRSIKPGHKTTKPYRAYCNQKHLGTFATEIDAAKAYDESAKIQHGEFANLNFK